MSSSSSHARSRVRLHVRAGGLLWRSLLRVLGRALAAGVERSLRASRRRVGFALVYHAVGEPAGNPRRELVPALATSLFARQLAYLVSRYRPVAASELLRATCERRRGDRFPVAITFDDDLRSHVEAVAPLLAAHHAPATFYITGGSLRGESEFWWDRLQRAVDQKRDLTALGLRSVQEGGTIHDVGGEIERLPPAERARVDAKLRELGEAHDPPGLLTIEDVVRLSSLGFEIGFHTGRHDRLPELDDEALERALLDGRQELETMLGRRMSTIAYPHGRADSRVAEAARATGFETGFTGDPVPVTASSEPLLLGRLSPSYHSLGELAFGVAWAIARASSRR